MEVLGLPVTALTVHGYLRPSHEFSEWEREPFAVGIGPDHGALAVWASRDRTDRMLVTATTAASTSFPPRCWWVQCDHGGSVALGVSKIEGDLIGEVSSHPCVVAAGVCVCWVPVPAGRHRARRAVVSALHSLNSRLVRSWLAVLGSCGRSAPAGVDHGLGEDGDVAGVQPGDSVAEVDGYAFGQTRGETEDAAFTARAWQFTGVQ
jgi:hypothetical protein